MKPLTIVIADDHAVIRDGLKLILDNHPDFQVVGEACRGEDACSKVQALKPDVVLMDVAMPGLGGAAATRRIRESCPQTRVLALSAYEDDAYIRQLLAFGASGYLLKQSATNEIARAIRIVAAGDTYTDPTILSRREAASKRQKAGGVEILSNRESEILRYTARGMTNKEIANLMMISVKTVETYKTRFCRKLNLQSRADIVRFALLQGWLNSESGPAEDGPAPPTHSNN